VLDKEAEEKLKAWERVRDEILNDPKFLAFISKRLKERI